MKKPIKKSIKKKGYILTPRRILLWTGLIMAAILVVLAALVAYNYFALDGPTMAQGSNAGKTIITALEKYKTDRSAYPDALNALVPAYLASLPAAAPRYPFNYEVCPGANDYRLSFKLGQDPVNYCTYSGSTKSWACSNAIFESCTTQ